MRKWGGEGREGPGDKAYISTRGAGLKGGAGNVEMRKYGNKENSMGSIVLNMFYHLTQCLTLNFFSA